MTYSIGEIAKLLNVTPSTLRYYDKEGLLPFVERSTGGIRKFKEEDLSALRIIECMKKTGMPIKDIKHFMDCTTKGDDTIDERLAIIDGQRHTVMAQIAELQEMLEMLSYKSWYYHTAKEAGTCKVHDTLQRSDIPQSFHKFLHPTEDH